MRPVASIDLNMMLGRCGLEFDNFQLLRGTAGRALVPGGHSLIPCIAHLHLLVIGRLVGHGFIIPLLYSHIGRVIASAITTIHKRVVNMPPRVRRDIRTALVADIVFLRHRVMPYLMRHRVVVDGLVLCVVVDGFCLGNPVVLMRRGVILFR